MKQPISLSLSQDVCASLARVATDEERSRSQVAERLIRAALATRQVASADPPASDREVHANG
jgi:hypothetical protein